MGGTFLRFTIGTRGASAAHVAYISRPSAVMERDEAGDVRGFFSQGLPQEVTRVDTFDELRENLVLYARMREDSEEKGRTHYRTLISFERQESGAAAAAMVRKWLSTTLPGTQAIVFVHQNTAHTHAHVWIDARKADGRKLDLSPRQYRTLDEAWNRVYSRTMGRDEREHLDRKRHGRQERKEIGERNRTASENGAQRESTRPQRGLPAQMEIGARTASGREPALTPGERICAQAASAHDTTLREVEQLRRDAAKLDRGPDREPAAHERERV